MKRSPLTTRSTHAGAVFILALVSFALLLVAAGPGAAAPALTIGPVNVANGLATLNGSIGQNPTAALDLTINGQPIGVNASGHFNATVNLNGASQIKLVLKNPANGQESLLSIPVNLAGAGGVIPGSVLDPLKVAGVTVSIPPGGFQVAPGGSLTVDATVLSPNSLLSLTINGQAVTPGPGGSVTTTVPPGTREIVVVATGTNGVSETTTYPVLTSSIGTTTATSVAAGSAVGLRITRVRYLTAHTRSSKHVPVIVTVKDKRGLLVRGASVRISSLPGGYRFSGKLSAKTNRVGTAKLMLKPSNNAFGKRLSTRTTARTPSAAAQRVTAVKLPALARR
jgi:hypothetical protein